MDNSVIHHEEVVDDEKAGKRLDSFVLYFPWQKFDEFLAPSRTQVQKWIRDGHVTVNEVTQDNKAYKVRVGERVVIDVEIEKNPGTPPPQDLDIEIVYQDDQLIVIDKPPGVSSHAIPSDLKGSVVNFLYHIGTALPPTSHPLRPGIVHRLDKNTTGLMVIAKSDQAMHELIEMIKRREVERKYIALVFGNMPLNSGTIDAPVGRYQFDRRKMAVTTEKQGRHAKTHYRVLARYPGFTLVGCKLDTGRTHQIRVHLSHLGYPVAGDPYYGGRRIPDKMSRILKGLDKSEKTDEITEKLNSVGEILKADLIHLLHAASLQFPHPITNEPLAFKTLPHRKFSDVLGILESIPHEVVNHEV